MSGRYAAETEVPIERSKMEIESTLRRYGASSFGSAWDGDKAMIEFVVTGRRVRFIIGQPNLADFEHSEGIGRKRTQSAQLNAWEMACRQSWRALALVVKAKLEAVAAEIVTFDEEFMAHIVMPNGKTIGDHVLPQLEALGDGQPLLALPR